jgi:hypothetical protein
MTNVLSMSALKVGNLVEGFVLMKAHDFTRGSDTLLVWVSCVSHRYSALLLRNLFAQADDVHRHH